MSIDLLNPQFLIGMGIAVILLVFYLVRHYHGKNKSQHPPTSTQKTDPLSTIENQKIVAQEANKVVISAVSEVSKAVAEVKNVADKIHDHLTADKKPEVPPEPPKAA